MTTNQTHITSLARTTCCSTRTTTDRAVSHGDAHDLPEPVGPSLARRLWEAVRVIIYGFDAAALIAHGSEVPEDHPARRRERDRVELERRLAVRYPRT